MPDFAKQYEMMYEEQLLRISVADLIPAALVAFDAELRRRGNPECQRKLAEPGSASAQFNVGVAYRQGKGLPLDYAPAAVWFRKAAEQGFARAQLSLGAAYYYGEGVPQDYAQAAIWFRKAAEQGDATAQFNLGAAYYEGQGVPQDYAQATSWYRKAAEQGHATAQFNLGKAYYDGQGVPQDFAEACCWLGLAESGKPEGIMAADVARLKADAVAHLAEQSSGTEGGSVKPASAAKRVSATILVCEKCDLGVYLSASSETPTRKVCPNGHRLQRVQSFFSAVVGGLVCAPVCVVLGQAALAIPGRLGTTIFEFSLLIMITGPIGYLVRALLALKKGGSAGRLAGQYFGISLGWVAMFGLLVYLTRVGLLPPNIFLPRPL